MAKLGKRKCKQCGTVFQKVAPLQFLCSFSCLLDYRKDKELEERANAWKKEKKVLKEKLITLSQYKKRLETEVNKLIRRIDYGNTCMMCDKGMNTMFACHYHSVGSNDSLRFNLLNIWGGCYSCNGNKGGNIPGYDMQLLQKGGRERWEYIKFEMVKEYQLVKLTREQVKELIPKVRKIWKEVSAVKRSMYQRWQLREKLNKEIGIYMNEINI